VNNRLQRVEELLRRSIAEVLLRGDVRDPRLGNLAALSITAVKVAPDLGSARVFIDTIVEGTDVQRALQGLNGAAGLIRSKIGPLLRMKRTPSLRFEHDSAIERGHAIERALQEIKAEDAQRHVPSDDPASPEDEPSPEG
jgi:ribosome-binding factor A